MSKLIVVLGGTGSQGGSVIETFLNEPGWKVRTVTRDPSKPSGKKLEARGVEVVKGDLNDVDSLVSAFQGANLVFGVTDFWGIFFDPTSRASLPEGTTINQYSLDTELEQGKNIAKALSTIVDTSLELYVWSSLSNATKWSNGKYRQVYHFDSKAKVLEYIHAELPELAKKTSNVHLGFYYDNIKNSNLITKAPDGVYEFAIGGIPGTTVPWVDTVADTGKFVKGLWGTAPGKTLLGVSDLLSFSEYAELWGKSKNLPARWKNLSVAESEALFGAEMGAEVWESNKYTAEFGWTGGEEGVVSPKDLGIETTTAVEYLSKS